MTKIIDSRMVMVEIEDGFEIPCLINDLVIDYRNSSRRMLAMAVFGVLPRMRRERVFIWLSCLTSNNGC